MVRLKGLSPALRDTRFVHFNSTMVRLKDSYKVRISGLSEFQFHYGTIKSIAQNGRFEGVIAFQFHYGTIKRMKNADKQYAVPNFNSTMVRLKERHCNYNRYRGGFQFHYGTIKR